MEISTLPHQIIGQIPVPISIIQDDKIVYANKKFQEITGFPSIQDLIGVNFSDHIQSKDRNRVKQAIEKGDQNINNIKILDYHGKPKYITIKCMDATWMGKTAIIQFTHDITEHTLLNRSLEEYTERLEALHQYTVETRDRFTIDKIAEKTIDTIKKLLDTNICSIGLIDGNQLDFRYQGIPGLIQKLPLDEPGVTIRAIKTGKTQRIQEVSKDPDYRGSLDTVIGSELTVPIKTDEIIGVINIESEHNNAFSEEDQKIVEILAELFASEVEKIKYIDQVAELERNRSKELLAGTNQVTRMVKHDIKGPLSVITNSAYLMKNAENDKEELATLITENVMTINTIIDDLGQMTLTEAIAPVPADLITVISETIKTKTIPPEIKVNVENSHELLYMNIDVSKIKRAIDNLLRNSVEAMPDGGEINIVINSDNSNVYINIQDTSAGIPSENRDKIFKLFFTTKQKGTGLGLSIVKQIIEAHKGSIKLDPGDGQGTRFSITLPLTHQ